MSKPIHIHTTKYGPLMINFEPQKGADRNV